MERFEKDFDEWFYKEYSSCVLWDMWQSDEIPFSMQWGVYVDFFDEHGILIEMESWWIGTKKVFDWKIRTAHQFSNARELSTRKEARKAALEKAIEIYNTKD